MTADDIIWRPRPEVAARSRIGTFLHTQSIATLSELQRRSVADPEWYWTKVVEDLGIRWLRAPRCVLDDARGPAWPVWFPGGLMNLADSCVDRHVESGRAARRAHRRDLHAVLLRLRRPGGRLAAARQRGEGAHHRRRVPSPRPGRADEGDR